MPAAPDAATAPEVTPDTLSYATAPKGRGARVLRRFRPGTAGFFVLVALLTGAAAWGAWKGMLYRDRKAFEACSLSNGVNQIIFTHAPSRGALRHLARQPGGPWELLLYWPAAEGLGASAAIGTVKTAGICVGPDADADALLVQLARPDSGLKAVTYLGLGSTRVTDAGLMALARPDSGLKVLTDLSLSNTRVTDAGLMALSRPDSGLKALTWLDLSDTRVTDAGLMALSRPDSGLKALTHLYLNNTRVTDAGLMALSRPDSGLKALTRLYLINTRVTDVGLMALARPDSGLKALTALGLDGRPVTDAGVRALQQARPALDILR